MFLPAGDRLVYPMRGDTPAFAPYIAESYRGDFVATVTVHRHSAPADATGFATDPLTGSGLIAVFDDKTILSFSRVSMPQKGDLSFRSTFRYPSGSNTAMGGSPRNKTKNESTTLRLIRSGEQLNMDYSFDSGKTWQRFTNFQRPTSDEVKVGIYAEHSCDAVTEASFEGFSIKKYVEEKKP